jgi:hypothetical protein
MERKKIFKYAIDLTLGFVSLFILFVFCRGIYLQAINDNEQMIQEHNDKVTLTNDEYCIKYYSDYKVSYLPVSCLKTFK